MTGLIAVERFRSAIVPRLRRQKRSVLLTSTEMSSDEDSDSDYDTSSDDESSSVLVATTRLRKKHSKTSRRKTNIQTLPFIINAQPAKSKKKHRRQNIQQLVINAPKPPKNKKEIIIKEFIDRSLSPDISYVPVLTDDPFGSTTALATVIEKKPLLLRSYRSPIPTLIQQRPLVAYRPFETSPRRLIRVEPSCPSPNSRSVRLPRHAKTLVNRFLNGMEHAHGYRHCDGSDSDCSIDDCKVCRRLRSAMGGPRRRRVRIRDIGNTDSEDDLYHGSRIVFDTEPSHTHKHGHSNNCKVCNLLEKSDFVISTTKDRSSPVRHIKKRREPVHVVESFASNIKPAVETTTTTTTTHPNTVVRPPAVPIPPISIQPAYYPSTYPTYMDPTGGMTYDYSAYGYDPNWQYNPSGTTGAYDYSSYYTDPTYTQNVATNPQYDPAVVVGDSTISSTHQQQQHIQTTTTSLAPNVVMDKSTYTRMSPGERRHKPTTKTVIVHNARNPTPRAPKIIIEHPRPSRLPRKLQTTTVLKERTTQTPHTTTTTYLQT